MLQLKVISFITASNRLRTMILIAKMQNKNIILMHHGTIKLYSEEGMGTTFTFRIPLNYVESDDEDKNEN